MSDEVSPAVEPLLQLDDIQGNSLAGFKKDFQCFLFLAITERSRAKRWLRWLAPSISRLDEVFHFNREFRAQVSRGGSQLRTATWLNVGFTHDGIVKLTSADEAAKFDDVAFRYGLYERSPLLGDPADPSAPGHRDRWLYGGKATPVDLLVLVASDKDEDLRASVARLEAGESGSLDASGLRMVFRQWGRTRRDHPGREHFGFKDGISQPAVRGRVGERRDDYLFPRWFHPSDPRALRYAAPGQPLVWPGAFVLGLESQSTTDEMVPTPAIAPSPTWARNGSYLVVRRLRQNVHAFWKFAHDTAAALAGRPGFEAMTPVRVASALVGRWPSGAPLMRSPTEDAAALARDDFAVNNFDYLDETATPRLLDGLENNDALYPRSVGDNLGTRCPFAAHIRKANPRDQGTDLGGPRTTLGRLVLRRGIPYGEPAPAATGEPVPPDDVDRGLVFASYQSSIVRQFEFLIANWANSITRPANGGHDPVIGQQPSNNRARLFDLVGTAGQSTRLALPDEWVTPTGGGYFFSPSISSLRDVLSE